MSRSGYTDDCENLELYRNAVDRALKGKRGQAFLIELRDALDAMPVKRLIVNELVAPGGDCCALGAVAQKRDLDTDKMFADDPGSLSDVFGIAQSMAAEIMYENDECGRGNETPEERWVRMRKWVDEQIVTSRGEGGRT